MAFNLVGKVHKTIIVEGVHLSDHEDCAKFITSVCGGVERWESVEKEGQPDRLWIIFENVFSVETAAVRLEGTSFRDADNIMSVRRADEKLPSGKSILSNFTTAATLAPRTVSKPTTGGGANIAGLLGAAKGSGGSAVQEANARRAGANAMMGAMLAADGNAMRLFIGGPKGWKAGDANNNAPVAGTNDGKSAEEVEADEHFAAIEAAMKANIDSVATVKTSTDNLMRTEGEVAAEKARAAAKTKILQFVPVGQTAAATAVSNPFELGNKTIPSNMLASDVEHFMTEHLRRQTDALIKLGEEYALQLSDEIRDLQKREADRNA